MSYVPGPVCPWVCASPYSHSALCPSQLDFPGSCVDWHLARFGQWLIPSEDCRIGKEEEKSQGISFSLSASRKPYLCQLCLFYGSRCLCSRPVLSFHSFLMHISPNIYFNYYFLSLLVYFWSLLLHGTVLIKSKCRKPTFKHTFVIFGGTGAELSLLSQCSTQLCWFSVSYYFRDTTVS